MNDAAEKRQGSFLGSMLGFGGKVNTAVGSTVEKIGGGHPPEDEAKEEPKGPSGVPDRPASQSDPSPGDRPARAPKAEVPAAAEPSPAGSATFPDGRQTKLVKGTSAGGQNSPVRVERRYKFPYAKVWGASKMTASQLELVGKRPISKIDEKKGSIRNSTISKEALAGAEPGTWLDEFTIDVLKISVTQSKVAVRRKVVALQKKEATGQKYWQQQRSNQAIETWIHSQISSQLGKKE